MKKVMLVFGTRPEAIKMAPLCKKLLKNKDFETIVCVTAQHREMLDQVLSIFDLSPDIDLDLMKDGQDLCELTSNILLGIREALNEHKPDIVLVHGDTTTSFATALACYYLGIKVGHVEAGLRTFDINAPFPEEYNRQSTGIIADYHFAPTESSKQNLLSEGMKNVFVTGNTVIDALYLVLKLIEDNPSKKKQIVDKLSHVIPFNIRTNRFVLITGHRRENFGNGFLEICEAIKELAIINSDIKFVYPVHLNPNVKKPVNEKLSDVANIFLIDPLEYEEFIFLLKNCYLVLTDSGGIQEEAPSLGKPVLVMRNETERPEALEAGTVKLVGASKMNIISSIDLLLKDEAEYKKMSHAHNPFGDGKSCDRIVELIMKALND